MTVNGDCRGIKKPKQTGLFRLYENDDDAFEIIRLSRNHALRYQ